MGFIIVITSALIGLFLGLCMASAWYDVCEREWDSE